MIAVSASCDWPSSVFSLNGWLLKSTSTTSSVMTRVPKLIACCRIRFISSGPVTACGCSWSGSRYVSRCSLGSAVREEMVQFAGRKAGIVLDLGRQGELPQRQRAVHPVLVRLGPFEHERPQVRASGIDGRRPAGGTAADDDHVFGHRAYSYSVVGYFDFAELYEAKQGAGIGRRLGRQFRKGHSADFRQTLGRVDDAGRFVRDACRGRARARDTASRFRRAADRREWSRLPHRRSSDFLYVTMPAKLMWRPRSRNWAACSDRAGECSA